MSRPRVLVADDKENMRRLLASVLGDLFEITTAGNGREAIELATTCDFDVVLADIRMPEADGFAVLHALKQARPDVEVVLMTAYGSVQKAVEAIKAGAYDYLAKPFEPDDALLTVERAVERKRLREQARNLRAALDAPHRFDELLGKSAAMQRVFSLLDRAAATDATVLVTGESGTGKELAARAIHRRSARRDGPFLPVNCAAIPEALMESELFGHAKGAFTGADAERRGMFEQASGGTLFLDEIGELPLSLQAKLTRALQEKRVRPIGHSTERSVDVRVIAATNADLKRAVSQGRFREDLYYRLNVLSIHLPPLRERSEDLMLLTNHFLEEQRARYGARVEGFAADALEAMMRYGWPGNVRELENAVERALAVAEGPRIPLEALPPELYAAGGRTQSAASLLGLPYKEAVERARERFSREYLIALMREFGGNVTRAAEHSGMERESLHRLLRRYRIRSHEFRGGPEPKS